MRMLMTLTALLLNVQISARSEPVQIDQLMFNIDRPLISEQSARIIAKTIMEDYYPSDVFRMRGNAVVEDVVDRWRVHMDNSVKRPEDDALRITELTIDVSKSDGAMSGIRIRR